MLSNSVVWLDRNDIIKKLIGLIDKMSSFFYVSQKNSKFKAWDKSITLQYIIYYF